MKKTYHSNDRPQEKKAKSKKEIAEAMGIGISTLQRRLRNIGMAVPRGLIFPEMQLEIYERLGWREMMRFDAK
ncbi:MAG: hypothetical protein IPJ82_22715 [Lewinellaceae bacterium]|nr:hypothetical protein [Lewinellaceae bacterium]